MMARKTTQLQHVQPLARADVPVRVCRSFMSLKIHSLNQFPVDSGLTMNLTKLRKAFLRASRSSVIKTSLCCSAHAGDASETMEEGMALVQNVTAFG